MGKDKNNDDVCVSHVLLPTHDPKNQHSDQEIQHAVQKLGQDLGKNPNVFGIAAVQLSTDYATTLQNPKLVSCVQGIQTENKDEKIKQAATCMEQHGGELPCMPKKEFLKTFDPQFANAALKLGENQVGTVTTQFGHHIIKRNPRKGL